MWETTSRNGSVGRFTGGCLLWYMPVSGEYQWELLRVWEVGLGFGAVKLRLSFMLVAI